MRYAVIDGNGIVSNIIILNDPSHWIGSETVVLITDGELVDIGYSYEANAIPRFTPTAE